MKNPEKVAQGKRNREAGARFERKVRKQLEKEGWIVDKWTNNVDLDNSCIVPAKSNRFRSRSCGFPDFVALLPVHTLRNRCKQKYNMMLVECKVNGKLSKVEKLKMEWLDGENIECWVASRKGTSVEYKGPNIIHRRKAKHQA